MPRSIAIADLSEFFPYIRAGARALRERERWADDSFLRIDADIAADDASALEALALWIDQGCVERPGDGQ